MTLKIYNTLTRKKEDFVPLDEKNKKVKMYVCGPTVYNYVHIGNVRAYIFADTLGRIIKFNGYKLKEVMNITDVDDKTIRDSQKENINLKKFTNRYEKAFLENIKEMNIKIPEHMPRATENIEQMADIIKKLLDKGYAYKTKDGIYFSIQKSEKYGELAGLEKVELKTGASNRVLKDEYEKDNADDFALWKFYTKEDGDVFWETEIGKGRPGWHIECSAMSSRYLGKQFDIHTGGIDLIFPHHTNEIAQSEAAFDVHPWVKYWMHNEHVMVNNKKMSKSLGNFYTLEDIKNKGFDPLVFRYFILLTHYRKKLNFTIKNLQKAQNAYQRLKNIISELGDDGELNKKYLEEFEQAINDDLNIPEALQVLWKLLRDKEAKGKIKTVEKMDQVLGLKLMEKEDVGLDELKKIAEEKITKKEAKMRLIEDIPKEVAELVIKRETVRKEKNFEKADELRDMIKEKGFQLDDTDEGVKVRKV